MAYASTTSHAEAAARLRAARRPFVTTHFKPDGDALGSVLALARALRAQGAEVDAAVAGPMDRSILGLAAPGEFRHAERGPVQPAEGCDLAVVLDTGAWSQLEHCRDWLRAHPGSVLGIDHHRGGDDVAPARIVDPACASCTQVLVAVLDELGTPPAASPVPVRRTVAEALFAGLATDTGWFRFSGADDRVFRLAARLLTCGVDKAALYRMLEQGDSAGRPLVAGRALSSIRYACDRRVAVMRLSRADFEATGTRVDDLAGLVNEPMGVATVEVSILLVEHEPRLTKASFRSKPPAVHGGPFVDVNHLAARFDGGGHVHAAGARIVGSLDDAADAVVRACEDYLEAGG